jgi:CRISPR-associated protein Csm4
MQMECWKIIGNGFHFGLHGLGQEETSVTFASDSLFAALIARLAESAGTQAVDEFIQPFLSGDPTFVLSSTYPMAGEVRFFPTPLAALQQERDANHSHPGTARAKELKKVKFISEGIFRRWLTGENISNLYQGAFKLQGKSVLVLQDELSKMPDSLKNPGAPLWAVEKRPRVTLGRSVQNSDIFFTGRVNFLNECALWFGIWWRKADPGVKSTVASLLAELADAGLGAERSIGFGQCQITPHSNLDLPDAGQKPWLSLSRYMPRTDEMTALADPVAAYGLKSVGGWLVSPSRSGQRRRPVNLLVEGSVFGGLDHQVPGQMVDVRPSYPTEPDPIGHAVYRNGFALPVGISKGDAA